MTSTAEMVIADTAARAVVDIIILSWDRLDDTIEAIKSAIEQQGIQRHIFVIDQGSKAGVVAALREFCDGKPDVTLVYNAKNTGVPGGRGQGSRLGRGEFLVALDNDAVFSSPFDLDTAVKFMRTQPDVGVLAFKIARYADGEIDQTSWAYHQKSDAWGDKIFEVPRFVGAGHMMRRSSYEAAGGYDNRLFFLHEEVDLSYRMLSIGQRLFYYPAVKVRHKVSAEHRVSWSGGRFYYDVRNKIYLAAKYNFSLPAALVEGAFLVLTGFRNGMGGAALRGFLGGISLIPRASVMKIGDHRLRLSREAKQRMRVLSAVADMSVFQRLKKRIGASVADGAVRKQGASR